MAQSNTPLTLGSLFDGSGGFPLAGILAGVTPVWASEIEPFAIRVTTKRLPQVRHYGDVSSVSGSELPPVDIITFGSPCQDMSIAGKRSGLAGSRSSLFSEAIRIVKEMRCGLHDHPARGRQADPAGSGAVPPDEGRRVSGERRCRSWL